jgi:hypothetical protein
MLERRTLTLKYHYQPGRTETAKKKEEDRQI